MDQKENFKFECKVKYEVTLDSNSTKKVSGTYLLDAISVKDAEIVLKKNLEEIGINDYEIAGISRKDYAEVFTLGHDTDKTIKWFACKLAMSVLDEKSGEEKKVNINILIEDTDFRHIAGRLDEGMKGTVSDYEILSVSLTSILEYWNNSK